LRDKGAVLKTLSYGDLNALNHAIGEIYAAKDVESFYRAVFTSIQSVIPSEYASFTDLGNKTNRIIKLTLSSDTRQTAAIKFKPVLDKHFFNHPLMSHRFSNSVAKITDFVSKNQFKGTAIYADYYRHMEIDAQISFSVPLSPELISHVTLSRNNMDFSERDRLILTLLRSHLITALRNVSELDMLRLERDVLQKGERIDKKGSALFEPGGIVVCITAFATELFQKYFGVTVAAGETMPEVLLQWLNVKTDHLPLKSCTAAAGMANCVERKPVCITKEDGCLTVKLAQDVLTGDLMLFLAETPTTVQQLKKMEKFGLSQRETEVLYWLAKGRPNAEIATFLCISKRTIEKHIERIFDKLGVESRASATAILQKELASLDYLDQETNGL